MGNLYRSWNFPGKSTGLGCHFLFQEIFLTQGLNPGLLHCRQILYHLSNAQQMLVESVNKYLNRFDMVVGDGEVSLYLRDIQVEIDS